MIRGLLIAAFLCGALARAEDRTFLIYDEQEISDHDRWQLYNVIIASIDPAHWREVTVPEAGTLLTVVDRYYDFWDKPKAGPTKDPFKETCDGLVQAIRTANEGKLVGNDQVPAGTRLRIPPLPVRGDLYNAKQPRMRLYNPATHSYAWVAHAGASLPVATVRDEPPATAGHKFRSARLTAIEIDWEAILRVVSQADAAGGKKQYAIPERSVVLKRERHNARLKLYASACDGDGYSALISPHAEDASAELEHDRAHLAEIIAQNPPPPLVIIDWDIDPQIGGHGSKVLGVVEQVLEDLHLTNELRPLVRTFDLNPHNNADGLRKTLGAFQQQYKTRSSFSAATAALLFEAAYSWIDHPPPAGSPDDLEQDINEFVLQAVLWWFMFQSPSWVNLSFSVNYPQLQLLDASYMQASPSFATLAAGNAATAISSGAYPQAYAAMYTNVVNVTYGRSDGTVLGARSNESAGGVPVHVLARGCGFNHGTIHPTDQGSSFASPYVAVNSWLKYIFDRSVGPGKMRSALMLATRPTPLEVPLVRSCGTFEPELLFAPGTPHIVIGSERKSLARANIHVEYAPPDGHTLKDIVVGDKRYPGRLAAFECPSGAGTYCLWFEEQDKVTIGKFGAVSVTFSDGTTRQFTGEEFARNVTHACF